MNSKTLTLLLLSSLSLFDFGDAWAATNVDPPSKQPNILFILTDDQAPFSLGAYGNKVCQTPNIDALAARGMRIDQAYHMGAQKGAVCTPSRHMIMSGRTLWHIPGANTRQSVLARLPGGPPVQGKDVNPNIPNKLELNTIGAVFNRAGFDTMRTCKKGNSYAAANKQFTVVRDATNRKTGEDGSAWHADQVLEYLNEREKADDKDPFMIYFGLSHPHDPRYASEELLSKYGAINELQPDSKVNPKSPPLPLNYLPAHPFHDGHPGLRDEVNVQGVMASRTELTIRNEKGREYACIENIDRQVGRVVKKLEEMGQLENTIIIFTSDHGIAIGRHGLMGKQNLYEHSWRVPYIVAGPGVAQGTAKGNVYLLDTLATICDLAGVEPPETNEGVSFRPVLEGKQDSIRDVMYGCYCGGTKPGMRCIRKGDWKLIKYESLDGEVKETQLFNLAENPHELIAEHHDAKVVQRIGNLPNANQTNLAGNPAFAEKRSEMEALLLAEMERLDDPYRFDEGYVNQKSSPKKRGQNNPQNNSKKRKNQNKKKAGATGSVSTQTATSTTTTPRDQRPNIVYIICDDLGYGDVQCLNREHGKIPTPHMDQLAADGMTFFDAHSGSSVCTPTRYGLLTGRYSWRTKLQSGVVTGFAPCLIPEKQPTVASFLKEQGYDTAIIGKWHLNNRFVNPETGEDYIGKKVKSTGPIGAMIPDGPVHRGFDYFHGIHHARSMKAIIENDKVIEHDDEINFLPRETAKCVEYINSRSGKDNPFFLYVPLGSPHTPIVPSPKWQGKSGVGKYGDFVMQTDHCIGEISKALAANGFDKNTLVVCTSDNGCSKAAGIPELAEKGHRVSAHLRGSKADIWDGGHRVPFFVRWPGHIEPASSCSQTICHVDLFATVADILKKPIPNSAGQDSVSFLPTFSGKPIESTRKAIVHHSVSGHFAIRSGKWKLSLARGSGGWSAPREKQAGDNAPKAQLYDMIADPGEQTNLYESKSEVAQQLLDQLEEYVVKGRSTVGPKSANDIPSEKIRLWKSEGKKPANEKNKNRKKNAGQGK